MTPVYPKSPPRRHDAWKSGRDDDPCRGPTVPVPPPAPGPPKLAIPVVSLGGAEARRRRSLRHRLRCRRLLQHRREGGDAGREPRRPVRRGHPRRLGRVFAFV